MTDKQDDVVEGEVVETGALTIRPAAHLSPAERINQMTAGLVAVEAFQVAARKLSLKATRPNDWRMWNGRLRPEVSAADSIAATFGVKIRDVITEKKPTNNGYQIIATGTFELPMSGFSVELVMGSCRSDDDIVATRYDYDKETKQRIKVEIPAGDVDEATVTKKALANMRVNGIMSLFGLRNVTAEELKGVGIILGDQQKTTFSGKAWEMSEAQRSILARFHATEAEMEACKNNSGVTDLINKLKAEKRKGPPAGAPAGVAAPPATGADDDAIEDLCLALVDLGPRAGFDEATVKTKIQAARASGAPALKSLHASWTELARIKSR